VLAVFAASPAPPDILWRPLAVAVVLALAVEAVALVVLRQRHWAAVVSTAVVFLLAGLWPFAVLIGITSAWGLVRKWKRVGVGAPESVFLGSAQIDRALTGVGVAVLIIATGVLFASDPGRWASRGSVPVSDHSAELQDLYVIWLDGYPSTGTLREKFGFDNEAFLGDLAARGFDVADDSRSNYAHTWLTMSSMLHMTYVEDIPQLSPPAPDPVSQFKQLRRAVNEAPVLDRLREHGYTLVSSQGAFTEAGLRNADTVLDDGQLNQLEEQMMRLTALARIVDALNPDWFADQARSRVESSFDHLAAIANRGSPSSPVAMIAQVMAPHAPFVFGRDGSRRPAPECHPESCFLWETDIDELGLSGDGYRDLLVGQIQYTNARVLDIVDRISAARPEAIILVMSDHGTRFRRDEVGEYFQNFFAARTPGEVAVFPEDISPVNIFRYLFDAYMGEDADPLEYQAWYATSTSPLHLTRYE
jgi:hypothetical protein